MRESGIAHQGMQDRRRVCQPAGLDDDAVEGGDGAAVAPAQEILKGQYKVITDRAAQAPRLQSDEALLASLDQIVIEPDLAELVDDNRRARELRGVEQACEQRGLAAAEKAGQQRHGDHGGSTGSGAMRSRTG